MDKDLDKDLGKLGTVLSIHNEIMEAFVNVVTQNDSKEATKKSSRSNYFEIINEVKLSPEEERIINARFLVERSPT